MKTIGDKSKIAFEIAEKEVSDLRQINLWLNNYLVNFDDNCVYVPTYIGSLESECHRDLAFNKYAKYFEELSIEEIHRFILSTRDELSKNYDLEEDRIYPYYRFMDWDETTDNMTSFIFLKSNKLYITFEFWRDNHPYGRDVRYFQVESNDVFPIIKETAIHLS
jgi:hypothetical protein